MVPPWINFCLLGGFLCVLSGIGISTHLQEGMGAKLNASSGNCVDTAEGHCRGDSPSASNFGSNEEGIDSSGVDQINMKFASPELVGKTYGVDIAWPIHHDSVSTNFPWMPHNIDRNVNAVPDNMTTMPIQPLGDRQKVYEEFMDGCRKHYGARGAMCDETERERIAMNLRQPQNMQNYTELGFMKIRAPEDVFKVIKEFWDTNKHLEKSEQWPAGYTYVNNWVQDSTMVSVEDEELSGGGQELRSKIWNLARTTISEWTGHELVTSSLYGVRVYKEGAILAPHVDRLPLISSAIVNVDQDVDEPWPLEVYGHDGLVYNITMEPGDMVLYESHSVVHGRPFALKGRYYANIFIHFHPGDMQSAHDAAKNGDILSLRRTAEASYNELFEADSNGWQPFHEAARLGSAEILRFFLEQGAELDAQTNGGETALDLASKFHGKNSAPAELLRNHMEEAITDDAVGDVADEL